MCTLRITEMYWYYHFSKGGKNTLFIPVESVVDVNLTSLNNNTKHTNELKVTLLNKSSSVRVTTAHEEHRIPLSLNITLKLGISNLCKSLIRYWKSREHITCNIAIFGEVAVGYKWGNITDPSYGNYTELNFSTTYNALDFYEDDDKVNDKNIIYIQFCLIGGADATIGINITESYVIPNKTTYKCIYNDETANQNSTVLQFPSLLSELHNPSKLYINALYPNTNDKEYNELNEIIKLEIQPQSSEDDMEIIETVALGITAILSLLLSLLMFGIGIRCCCCHIKTGFCALGLFYEEQ